MSIYSPSTRIPPKKPHFFKPLLPGFHRQLKIPKAFFKYFNGQKCEMALLSSGRGIWAVKIKGCNFEQGWAEFATDHDLKIGDFVVFRHEGNMVFDVLVFDPSACEKEYPQSNCKENAKETNPKTREKGKAKESGVNKSAKGRW